MPKRLASEFPELPEYGLRTIFGDTVKVRILDFLILYRDSTYSKSEIARNSHVSWRSFNRAFPSLMEHGLVIRVKGPGKSKLYKFNNPGHVVSECLVALANKVAIEAAKKMISKEK